jgi:ArsR family transcriptional regulator
MDALLTALSAAADPTRLRLLALAATGSFCVNDFCDMLGQSQPRLSRHLKLLCEAGLLARTREGANAWFELAQGPCGALVRAILTHAPAGDPLLEADRRGSARVLAERARAASEKFRLQGADWDEMRALDLPAAQVERALLAQLPDRDLGRVLDIGTGTGRLLKLLAPRATSALGIDASRTMLALARVHLAGPETAHCSVRLADMYALPLPDESFTTVLLQMVLHYAEDPAAAMAEARRVLAPGGRLVIVDLGAHERRELMAQMAHRRLGFSDAEMQALLHRAGLSAPPPTTIQAQPDTRLTIKIWQATAPALAAPTRELEFSA